MDSIFEHYKRTGYLHHAYIIEGLRENIKPLLLTALREYAGIVAQGSPDVSVIDYQSFGIDESRELSLRQSRAGFGESLNNKEDSAPRKIFIISADSLTHEAQNALLKTFEEPTLNTHFFFIVPQIHTVLPTLISRVSLIRGQSLLSGKDESKDFAEKFLDSLSLEERFVSTKKLTETKKDEPIDREKIRRVLDHIERMLYTRFAGKEKEMRGDIFRDIYQAKVYLSDRGSSPKILLDHLAMKIPLRAYS